MEQVTQGLVAYGPVAMLAGMLILLVRDLVAARQRPDPEAQRELARAIEKLTMVLESMQRDHGKALEQIQGLLHDQGRVLQGLDFRTREMRDDLKSLMGGKRDVS